MTVIEINKASPPPTVPYPQSAFQPVQSFAQKLISTTITLAQNAGASGQPNTFAGTGSNSVALSGFRTRARITNAGGVANANAKIDIFGVQPSLINQVLQAGPIFNQIPGNSILISAGDAIAGMSPVFGGTIYFAQGLFSQQPDVPLTLVCQAGGIWQTAGVPPASFSGATDVATILSGLARAAGKQFENNGVTAQLSNPYYAGNLYSQVQQIAAAARINAQFVDGDTKLAIWPIGGSRSTLTTVPLIAPGAGMIGYPTFSSNSYMTVEHLFNPQVSLGGTIQVQSSIPQANGQWVVFQLDLALDSLVPKGDWKATAYCYKSGFFAPAPPQQAG